MTLYARAPWKGHTFPHKRIVRKVSVASTRYRCQAHDRDASPECMGWIERGDSYVRVSMPGRDGRRYSSSVKLCGPCGLHMGLATTDVHQSSDATT